MSDDRHREDPPAPLVIRAVMLRDFDRVKIVVRVHTQPIGAINFRMESKPR